MEEKEGKKKRLTISVDEVMYEKIRELCFKERISFNKFINNLIKERFKTKLHNIFLNGK
jgi:predicted CopG family antitoxin